MSSWLKWSEKPADSTVQSADLSPWWPDHSDRWNDT